MPIVNCIFTQVAQWKAATIPTINLQQAADIWRISVSSKNDQVDYFISLLSPDELQKAARYHQEKDRRRFIISRGALRIILSKYLKQLPQEIQFSISTNKKPVLQNNNINIHFNLSHSGDWILIAVGSYDIGIDVEEINPVFSFEDIFPISFTDFEVDAIRKSASPRKNFYCYWTRKEALAKASAKGLDEHFKDIPCLDGLHNISEEIISDVKNGWIVNSFDIDEHHIGSVAFCSSQNAQNVSDEELRWFQLGS